MSIKLMTLIWEDHTGELTGIEKSILLKLADYSSDDGRRIFPSIETLSLHTGFSRRTIINSLKTLEEKKRITKHWRKKGRVNISNSYKINVDLLIRKAQKISVDNRVGGSAPRALGVVHHVHRGSAPRAPDPSHDPSVLYLKDKQEHPPVDKNYKNVFLKKKINPMLLTGEDINIYNKLIEIGINDQLSANASICLTQSQINNIFESYDKNKSRGSIRKTKTEYIAGAIRGLLMEFNQDETKPHHGQI